MSCFAEHGQALLSDADPTCRCALCVAQQQRSLACDGCAASCSSGPAGHAATVTLCLCGCCFSQGELCMQHVLARLCAELARAVLRPSECCLPGYVACNILVHCHQHIAASKGLVLTCDHPLCRVSCSRTESHPVRPRQSRQLSPRLGRRSLLQRRRRRRGSASMRSHQQSPQPPPPCRSACQMRRTLLAMPRPRVRRPACTTGHQTTRSSAAQAPRTPSSG